jgi:hypothetical protein
MKTKTQIRAISRILMIGIYLSLAVLLNFCSSSKKATESAPAQSISSNAEASGTPIKLTFLKGMEHNYPLMVIWLETTGGEYIETLFVAESIGKGVFQRGIKTDGKWEPGALRRPAALPYWGHQRGIQADDGLFIPDENSPMPDAITGATPTGSFTLNTRSSKPITEPVAIMLEINQSWDWNRYWTNNKYPDDPEYKTSSQPALVYSAAIDPGQGDNVIELKPIGHSHYSGKDGSINTDLSTLTSALEIASRIFVTLPGENE